LRAAGNEKKPSQAGGICEGFIMKDQRKPFSIGAFLREKDSTTYLLYAKYIIKISISTLPQGGQVL
jgi:hypothetical protein